MSIGPFVRIYTGTHRTGPSTQRMLPGVVGRPVTIEEGAWIRIGATILPGVTIGRGSIVGAGSVVTSDVPPDTYVEGCPPRSHERSRPIHPAPNGCQQVVTITERQQEHLDDETDLRPEVPPLVERGIDLVE